MSRGKSIYSKDGRLMYSDVKCAVEGCGNRIKLRIVTEARLRGDVTPQECYHCSHPNRKQSNQGVKVMHMGQDTIA